MGVITFVILCFLLVRWEIGLRVPTPIVASTLMNGLDVSHESDSGDGKTLPPPDTPAAKTLIYATSNPYELQFGYSRAVRKGPHIFVSGTTSIDSETGYVQFPDSAYQQALVIFKEIINSIEHLQGSKEDIARVRMFVTEQEDTEAVGRALKESLGDVRPAATMIVGARFVSKDMRVEIEADAIVLT